MSTPRKYMFDASFDQPQASVAVLVNKPPPEPTFTGAELELARATALEAGRSAALAEASASIERQLVAATEKLAAGVPTLLTRDSEIRDDVERRAIELLRGLVAKTFPALA